MNRAIRWFLAVFLGALASPLFCHAEPRWCSTEGKDPTNTFLYPPIARAARVPGVVLVRMVYVPNGKVVRVEPVSGPPLLSSFLALQLMNWTVRTDAQGDELCQTLVVAKFTMTDRSPPQEPAIEGTPSVLRISVEAEPIALYVEIENIDPAPLRGFKRFRHEVKSRIVRVVHKVSDSR